MPPQRLARWSLGLGVLAVVVPLIVFVPATFAASLFLAILAVVCGRRARRGFGSLDAAADGRGFYKAGIVLGLIPIVVVIVAIVLTSLFLLWPEVEEPVAPPPPGQHLPAR